MADFGVYLPEREGSASPLSPVTPVSDASLWQSAGSMLENIGKSANLAQKAAQEEMGNRVLADFAREQLRIAEAVEMGDMSSMQARTRLRTNLDRAIANNPGLQGEFTKSQTAVLKSTGLGQAVFEGTATEKQQQSLEDKAVADGWVAPSATEDQKRQAAAAYAQFQNGLQLIQGEQAEVTLARSKVGYQSDVIGLRQKQREEQSRLALGQIAGAYQTKLGNTFEQIRQAHANGQMSALEAEMALDQAFTEVQQVSSLVGADAGSDYVNGLTKGMTNMLDNYKRYISGSIQLKDLETRNAQAIAIQADQILGDPKRAQLAAINQIYNNAAPVIFQQMSGEVARILDGNSNQQGKPADILPDTPEGQRDTKVYFNMLKDAMSKADNGGVDDPETYRQQLGNNIGKIFKGLEVYGPASSDSASYNNVVDFISDPAFGKYVGKNGLPDEQAAFKAGQVLEFEYVNKALPLIEAEWRKAMTGGRQVVDPGLGSMGGFPRTLDQKPASQLIEPKFIGSGITFVAKGGSNNYMTQRTVRDLNEKVAPVMNRLIRMTAHLDGGTDYRSTYEARFASVFQGEQETEE
jgi:hypothetical protein